MRWDFDASSVQTRRMSAPNEHQNWSTNALIFCLNSRAQNKYSVISLIHTKRKRTFYSFNVINKISFLEVFKYYQQNKITQEIKESVCTRECTIHHRYTHVMCSECKCMKIMHAVYFHVFWVSWVQIGCSMRLVYAGCKKAEHRYWFCYLPEESVEGKV